MVSQQLPAGRLAAGSYNAYYSQPINWTQHFYSSAPIAQPVVDRPRASHHGPSHDRLRVEALTHAEPSQRLSSTAADTRTNPTPPRFTTGPSREQVHEWFVKHLSIAQGLQAEWTIDGHRFDPHNLLCAVIGRGGSQRITKYSAWHVIAADLRFPSGSAGVAPVHILSGLSTFFNYYLAQLEAMWDETAQAASASASHPSAPPDAPATRPSGALPDSPVQPARSSPVFRRQHYSDMPSLPAQPPRHTYAHVSRSEESPRQGFSSASPTTASQPIMRSRVETNSPLRSTPLDRNDAPLPHSRPSREPHPHRADQVPATGSRPAVLEPLPVRATPLPPPPAQTADSVPTISSFAELVATDALPLPPPVPEVDMSRWPTVPLARYAMRCHELHATVKRMNAGLPARTVTREETVFWTKLLELLKANKTIVVPGQDEVRRVVRQFGRPPAVTAHAVATAPPAVTGAVRPAQQAVVATAPAVLAAPLIPSASTIRDSVAITDARSISDASARKRPVVFGPHKRRGRPPKHVVVSRLPSSNATDDASTDMADYTSRGGSAASVDLAGPLPTPITARPVPQSAGSSAATRHSLSVNPPTLAAALSNGLAQSSRTPAADFLRKIGAGKPGPPSSPSVPQRSATPAADLLKRLSGRASAPESVRTMNSAPATPVTAHAVQPPKATKRKSTGSAPTRLVPPPRPHVEPPPPPPSPPKILAIYRQPLSDFVMHDSPKRTLSLSTGPSSSAFIPIRDNAPRPADVKPVVQRSFGIPYNRAKVVIPIMRSTRAKLIARGVYNAFRDDDSDDERRGRAGRGALRPQVIPKTLEARLAKPKDAEPLPSRFQVRAGPAMVEPFRTTLRPDTLLRRVNEYICGWKGCSSLLASEWQLTRHLAVRKHGKQGEFIAGVRGEMTLYRCHWKECEGPCFASEASLVQHLHARHVSKTLACPYQGCDLHSPTLSHLSRVSLTRARVALVLSWEHVMKQHDSIDDVPRPLADLSERLPPVAGVPPLPAVAKTADLIAPWVVGTAAPTAYRAEWVRAKVQRECIAGDDAELHVVHPAKMLEPLEDESGAAGVKVLGLAGDDAAIPIDVDAVAPDFAQPQYAKRKRKRKSVAARYFTKRKRDPAPAAATTPKAAATKRRQQVWVEIPLQRRRAVWKGVV